MMKEKRINEFLFSTDKKKLQINYIHHFLSEESYWSKNIPIHIVEKSIEKSLCFGVFENNCQIGFARVITDFASFGYLADVFIDKDGDGICDSRQSGMSFNKMRKRSGTGKNGPGGPGGSGNGSNGNTNGNGYGGGR